MNPSWHVVSAPQHAVKLFSIKFSLDELLRFKLAILVGGAVLGQMPEDQLHFSRSELPVIARLASW